MSPHAAMVSAAPAALESMYKQGPSSPPVEKPLLIPPGDSCRGMCLKSGG